MNVGSLFTGIGGLDLGLERAGMRVVWQSEIDPYCCKVLAKHWPQVPNLGDITLINWSSVQRVDLICGGYPCQPFSQNGHRRGTDDPRHLWPHMLRSIRLLRPRFVLAENVAGHLGLGFDRVLADLAGIGFDAEWSTVSACSMGAPHMRDRLFILAHPTGERFRPWGTGEAISRQPRGESERRDQCTVRSWADEPGVCGVAYGVRARAHRLRALGNAVVPQVAEWVGHRIMSTT